VIVFETREKKKDQRRGAKKTRKKNRERIERKKQGTI
jgi:hypothetical protein